MTTELTDQLEMTAKTDSRIEAELDIIAELSLNAPTDNIKKVILLYDPTNSKPHHDTVFRSNCSKEEITSTLEFLGVNKKWKNYLANSCINDLICRIQNLMPEHCNACDMTYAVHREDPPILPCEVCGQDAHKPCLANTLNIDINDISQEIVQKLINPLSFSGLHFICKDCHEDTIHSDISGMTKTAAKIFMTDHNSVVDTAPPSDELSKTTSTSDVHYNTVNMNTSGEALHSSQVPSTSANAYTQPMVSNTEQVHVNGYNKSDLKTQDSKMNKMPLHKTDLDQNIPPTCRNFMRGNCRHGMSGKSNGICKFHHPKTCNKLLKHGTKSKLGCNKGNKCEHFHPKMCFTSLTKGECFNTTCNDKHIKGTTCRQLNDTNNQGNESPQKLSYDLSGNNLLTNHKYLYYNPKMANMPTNENHFLGAIRCLQADIMKAVDTKLSAITNMISTLQNQLTAQPHITTLNQASPQCFQPNVAAHQTTQQPTPQEMIQHHHLQPPQMQLNQLPPQNYLQQRNTMRQAPFPNHPTSHMQIYRD